MFQYFTVNEVLFPLHIYLYGYLCILLRSCLNPDQPINNIEAQNQSPLQYNYEIHLHQPIIETQSLLFELTTLNQSLTTSEPLTQLNQPFIHTLINFNKSTRIERSL